MPTRNFDGQHSETQNETLKEYDKDMNLRMGLQIQEFGSTKWD